MLVGFIWRGRSHGFIWGEGIVGGSRGFIWGRKPWVHMGGGSRGFIWGEGANPSTNWGVWGNVDARVFKIVRTCMYCKCFLLFLTNRKCPLESVVDCGTRRGEDQLEEYSEIKEVKMFTFFSSRKCCYYRIFSTLFPSCQLPTTQNLNYFHNRHLVKWRSHAVTQLKVQSF